ncbi:hypothetical protein [Caulobacter sp. NIBR2454]|uniref:hypothetical protein n=1 Tax=Caulobacter sp. NIBR2454 TaxID=3015996 RepID=UPI0022B67C9F|nr:hypothetical protein [Caulobacter sp. NIBR2454]
MSLTALTIAMAMNAADPTCAIPMWRPLYRHDADGGAVFGSKAALLDALRRGDSLRVAWGGAFKRTTGADLTVEHVIDPVFASIMAGEVVVQTHEHITLTGYHDPDVARQGPPTSMWRAMFTTKGVFDAVMVDRVTGKETRLPQRAAMTWLAFTPAPECDKRPAPTLAVPGGVRRDS